MVRKPCIYKNVSISMFRAKTKISILSEQTNIGYKNLCRKLNGETAVTIEEAIEIHKALGCPMPIEILFSRE